MLNVLAGFIMAGCFIVSGIVYQECRYRNLKKQIEVKALEKRIEELKLSIRENGKERKCVK